MLTSSHNTRNPLLHRTCARLAATVALGCAAWLPVQAHNVWLLPSSTVLSKPDWVTVDAAVSNDLFFFNHRPLGVDNLRVTTPDGSAITAQNAHTGRLRTVFDLQLPQPGTYRVTLFNPGLIASYKDTTGQTKRWRGTPEKFAAEVPADAQELKVTQTAARIETFITAGKPTPLQLTGQGLEMLPLTAHADFVKGETARFLMHADGKPAAGLTVTISAGARRYRDNVDEIKLTTDNNGEFSITWPTANMYWISASLQDDQATIAPAKERRLSYAGTVEVLP